MIDCDGHHVAWCHDYPHAKLCLVKQPFSKIVGHANAAVRCSVSWQGATMERDARPSEALHVGHVRVIVHVGVVLGFLLDNTEDPCWRLASLLPTRHRRS